MQRTARREGLLGRALTINVAVALCVVGLAPLKAAAQSQSTPPAYVAYRLDAKTTPTARSELLRKVKEAGLEPLRDDALDRAGLLVFETDHPSVLERTAALFRNMERVPINEFRGVVSVPTGNFYLRFKEDVTPATARKRVEALGFKVLTPATDSSSLLVVEGSKRPLDRQRELERLRQLEQLLFVAPNDIALPRSRAK